MIPVNPEPWEPDTWRLLLKTAVRSSDELLRALEITPGPLTVGDADTAPAFPVRVPGPFLARMTPGDPHDPLLLQVLARRSERLEVPGFVADAVGETGLAKTSGLIQKYAHRALLITSPACAVHCRYCFRRAFPYDDHPPAALAGAIDAIRQDPTLTEIIFSGGDPLTLPDQAFGELFEAVGRISHIRRLRIHTRLPIVLPQRITARFLDILGATRQPVVMVVHANHARELDAETRRAFALLKGRGVHLLNQAVLLKGINDSADAQCALAETLFDQGVLPYYLHLLDRVQGTHEFEVDAACLSGLQAAMHARLPGYLMPRLVREIAGAPGKTLLPFE